LIYQDTVIVRFRDVRGKRRRAAWIMLGLVGYDSAGCALGYSGVAKSKVKVNDDMELVGRSNPPSL
jgi:hypothetical protein